MLPKDYRLRLDKDIKMLFSQGKSIFGVIIGVKYKPNHLKNSRFAIVIGKKISKKAVIRNRLRRQISAILYEELKKFKINYDLIILVRPNIINKKRDEIKEDLFKIFKKISIL